MEKKNPNREQIDKHAASFIYWLIMILIMLGILAVCFGLVALYNWLKNMDTVHSFHIEFNFCKVAALVSLILSICCFIGHKRSAAGILAVVFAIFLFFSVRFAWDTHYVYNPSTLTLHNITIEKKWDYWSHTTHDYYLLSGYDEGGKKHSLTVSEYDYYDYRGLAADTAVITYLPHSKKIMNIDFSMTSPASSDFHTHYVTLNAINGGSSKKETLSYGIFSGSEQSIKSVQLSCDVRSNCDPYTIFVQSPSGTVESVSGPTSSSTISVDGFAGEDPKGSWTVWIENSGISNRGITYYSGSSVKIELKGSYQWIFNK